MKHLVFGLLAHVDAGKTTCSESILMKCGQLRQLGRVDHRTSFLDYDRQERQRGITIYSKQAELTWKDCTFTMLDTPGHVDFSGEMERVVSALDAAVLLVDGNSPLQPHTFTIFKLLSHYQIPTLIFVNKMDRCYQSKEDIMEQLKARLHPACFDDEAADKAEQIALTDDKLLEKYLQTSKLSEEDELKAILQHKCFPCLFGSALKQQNIENLLDRLSQFALDREESAKQEFGAKVIKITHDEQGHRLTHLKITSGKLKVKEKIGEEKVDQIRIYSGQKYKTVEQVQAGQVCAVQGFECFSSGQGIGNEPDSKVQPLSSYMTYRMSLPPTVDKSAMMKKLQQLQAEDPQLELSFETGLSQIQLQLRGSVQIEVLKQMIADRFQVDVEFDEGKLAYKETIRQTVEGVGHYEPLRHYSEVHLMMEPLPLGSGLVFATDCRQEELALSWQRLVLTHLQEKTHLGVLTGSPITDMKITLVAGKAHLKHTEGGDFRQATYRAVRQGLMQAESILLEPMLEFSLEIPQNCISKALFDLEQMNAKTEAPLSQNDFVCLQGQAAVRKMQHYHQEVLNYTQGLGRLQCSFAGYMPCSEQEEIVAEINYEAERDIDNPSSSVFCEQGAGVLVAWNEVFGRMHLKQVVHPHQEVKSTSSYVPKGTTVSEEELNRVFAKAHPTKQKEVLSHPKKEEAAPIDLKPSQPLCVVVDGYNIIYAWDELKELAKQDLNHARERLIELMSHYKMMKSCTLILVFDGYKVQGNSGEDYNNGSIRIVYTRQDETADAYIEKIAVQLLKNYQLVVATSDGLEQIVTFSKGARRMSARELKNELEFYLTQTRQKMNQPTSAASRRKLEAMRQLLDRDDFFEEEE